MHFSAILRVIYTKLYSITDICEFSERLSQHSAIALTFSRTSNFVLSNGYLQKNDDAGSSLKNHSEMIPQNFRVYLVFQEGTRIF